MDGIEGKRFLICHSIVHDLIGSTIVTLDLATFLKERGAQVLVYATFIGDPAMSLFAERGIDVVDDEPTKAMSWSDFDVVWVNSQVIPEAMVDQFLDPLPQPMPAFVFHHMSAIHYAPDEHPYIHQLEERLSSLSLFISTATQRDLLPYYERDLPTDLYANPTPAEFARRAYRAKPAPESVLVVSNHAPPEVVEAKELLRERGLRVLHLGAGGDEQTLITPDVLEGHDVVITIGKTVQYCLVAGRPVYVHDHFGGYGYLTEENLPYAKHRNYSGRGGHERTAADIVREVLDGYGAAAQLLASRRDDFVREYSIENVLPRVLQGIVPREIEPFETSYHHTVRSAQAFGARFFHYWGHNANEVRNREALTGELERTRAEARAEVERLHAEHRAELERIRGSWSFRVGRAVVAPLSAVARGLRRVLGRG